MESEVGGEAPTEADFNASSCFSRWPERDHAQPDRHGMLALPVTRRAKR
jgi:hypothetical protein